MDAVYLTVIQPDASFKAVDKLSSADVKWQEGAGPEVPQARLEK